MANKDPDLKKIQDLIKIMKKNNLVEMEIKHGDDKIFLKRAQENDSTSSITAVPMIPHSVPVAHIPAEPAKQEPVVPLTEEDEDLIEITSPIVGTFYAKPGPDSENFVEVGSHVERNTIVCILEAMKVMNEIKAEISGTIVEIMVENGQAVEYGQVLFKVKPD
ncbi:MAG: acetyl-CoA carboxylase biotin carboxyl carrier protein [Planctomycetota bacterium]|jgi:acetyl-CoA carboxylase biotin carboxyl carrier protein